MERDFKKLRALPCSLARTRLTVTSSNVIVRQYKVVALIIQPAPLVAGKEVSFQVSGLGRN